MSEFGKFQSDIPALPTLDSDRYENIFKVYTTDKTPANRYYYYNILKKVEIPSTLDANIVDTLDLDRKLPWTILSHKLYGTQHLWWLLFLLNKPKNIFYAEAGTQIKYILTDYIDLVIDNIQSQISK